MNANHYINQAVRKMQCSTAKKKEIKKEFLTEIQLRQEQGEDLESILSQMGTQKEIADSFNENLSPKEKKQYLRRKIFLWIAVTAFVVLGAALLFYKAMPQNIEIEKSEYFEKQILEETAKETISLLDDKEYSVLQENASEKMKAFLNAEAMESAKTQISDKWGERQSFGTAYMTEVVQGKEHFAVVQIAVSYEYVTAVYTLTYDKDMNLAGLYVK